MKSLSTSDSLIINEKSDTDLSHKPQESHTKKRKSILLRHTGDGATDSVAPTNRPSSYESLAEVVVVDVTGEVTSLPLRCGAGAVALDHEAHEVSTPRTPTDAVCGECEGPRCIVPSE